MLELLIRLALMTAALLYVVPFFTGGGVAVREGSFLRGLLSVFVLGLINSALWFVFALVTMGGVVMANLLTFGVINLLINSLSLVFIGKALPETLYVRSFGSAFLASVVMTVCGFLIHMII